MFEGKSILVPTAVAALLAVTLALSAAVDRSYAQDQGVPATSGLVAGLEGETAA